MTRTSDRESFDVPVRLRLLEKDADDHDSVDARLAEALEGMRKILVGILVSVTTASILLVVNVLVIGGK